MHRTCVIAILLVSVCALWGSSHAIPHRPRSSIGPRNLSGIPLDRTDDAGRWVYTPSDKHQRNNLVPPRITDEEYRLPTHLRPTVYTIHLTPFIEPDNFTIRGSTEIFFDCISSTNNITMNAIELTIDLLSIAVWDVQANNPIAVVNFIDEQSYRQMITIQTASQLEAGKKYKISMKFISILNDQKRGFYRSSYVENGVTKWLAVSDFESSDARRAFPCFDEPSMKANFSIVLGRKTSMTSASNMRQLSTNAMEGMPGYVWDYYETSPLMSTYLVAFLVSEYVDVPSSPHLSDTQFRVWTRPEAENLTYYSGEIGPKILEFFGDYFMIDYPLWKEDFVSVPDVDFTAGAMENWGMITFRESDLLIDVETAAETRIQRVAVVVAHELAHQWFGDLVTLEWWNAIWLNEGFAEYLEYLGVNEVEPTFGMLDQFLIDDMHRAFLADSVETSRPLHWEVSDPSEINNYFDTITYSKGASIVRMMADFIGLETFNRGLTRYLSDQSYENGNEDELWEALQYQANMENITLPATVKEIMDTWTLQMGYPVITVTRNYAEATATFAQERFLSRKDSPNPTALHWWVPLTYRTGGKPTERAVEWLSKDEEQKTVTISALNVQWILVNLGQQNFYRVRYDEINYAMLADELVAAHTNLLVTNRAQLLDDAFNLALANMIPYKHALDFSVYLSKEQEYVPWAAVLSELNYIDIMLHNMKEYADWKNHMSYLVIPYYNLVGFEELDSDEHLTIYKRNDATSWACRLQVADCVSHAKMHYANLMKDPNMRVSPNQRNQILRRGVENGERAEWQFAFDQYKATGDTTFLVAMTYTRQSSIIYEMLEMMLSPNSGFRLADINTLFSNIAANPLGNSIALNFLSNRWEDIEDSWLGTEYFVSFFRSLCDRENTQEELDKLENLRTDHPEILGSSPTVQQGIDVVKANMLWIELHLAEIGTWLKENPPAPTPASTDAPTAEPTTESSSSTTEMIETTTTEEPSGSAGLHHFYVTSILVALSLAGWTLVQ